MSKLKVELNRDGVREVCLQSQGVDDLLVSLGNSMKGKYGKDATVELKTGIGARHRVFVKAPMKEASKDNKLLKAMK